MSFPPPLRKQLEKLPRGSATWQVVLVEARVPFADGSQGIPCFCVQGDGMVRASSVTADPPRPADWQSLLLRAIQSPGPGMRPCLPGVVRVADAVLDEQLAPFLRPLKVRIEVGPDLTAVAEVMASLLEALAEGGRLELPDHEAALYAAAAEFARLAPWLRFSEEPEFAFETEQEGWQSPLGVVMGGLGQDFGLSLFRDRSVYDRVANARNPTEAAERFDAISANFEPTASSADRKRAAARKLEVVPGRWPSFIRSSPGRLPSDLQSPQQYRLLTRALQAVSAWVRRYDAEGEFKAPLQLVGAKVSCRLTNPDTVDLDEDDDDPPLPEDPVDRAGLEAALKWHQTNNKVGVMLLGAAMEHAEEDISSSLEVLGNLCPSVDLGPFALPWLVYQIELPRLGRTVSRFLHETNGKLNGRELAWLHANDMAIPSVWQVGSVRPGVGLRVKDLLAGEERFVWERQGSTHL
ncbi:MAG: DUF7309 domain-containing protein, partial [Myxococcota bacterium]